MHGGCAPNRPKGSPPGSDRAGTPSLQDVVVESCTATSSRAATWPATSSVAVPSLSSVYAVSTSTVASVFAPAATDRSTTRDSSSSAMVVGQ